ncbi:bifunctional diguanylate cyclase/phosphodiesterase [Actinoplanes sp. L3-i22]|uniref:putative bifunctional diguanylate cyclase/phosphodiesterase n=1 Tax=Actinoplanes sp. L3-i22 TaxID=2836373 RepID=UPI001C76744C|nr:EAL domain-containing protein [Actinoplanes sp. L3-i22]BCY09488.1 hypothetical protein L3i22_045760 [Actinoplanes sp. L3-i22]
MVGRSGLARAARYSALFLGLLVLVASVVASVVTARDKQAAAQDSQLRVELRQQIDVLDSYFERARSIDALLAANPVFADFYRVPGTNPAKINAGGATITRVNNALAYLEEMYPGRIGEACFIDSSGAEIARVVNGVPARPDKLSQDEGSNAFFAPTLALGAGQVYQAEEYESQDTHDEVISNSTVVAAAGHVGIVHFEITLESFRTPTSADGFAASILDAGTGRVIVDSRAATTTAGRPDLSLDTLIGGGSDSGVRTAGGRRFAYQHLPSVPGNVNNWYVAVSAPAFGSGWTRGLSVGSLALVAAAMLTVLIAGASWAGHLRAARRAAVYDPLTGLPNRILLSERIEATLRTGRPATVVLLDLQRFREVNDLLGHHLGDVLLNQVAERLLAAVGPDAMVARLGGDDFAVFLPGYADLAVADKSILAAFGSGFVVGGLTVDLDAEIGVAYGPQHGEDAAALLRNADSALRLAKQYCARLQVYDPAAEQSAPNRLALLGDLRRALDTGDQITVHYQPKIDLRTGELAGAEALIRWHHPELGRMNPDMFIPTAETTTLIHALTDRVLTLAVAEATAWAGQGLQVPVAVNLSTRCLLDPTLPGRVLELLDRTGLPVASLELEVTESMVMADPVRAEMTLRELHDAGIRLSIDDFGTGHSSMAYLQRLPVDELKIDRTFIRDMAGDREKAVLVSTMITLGHNLGLSVVAEGAETEQDVAVLRDLGCDIVQGYYFARPMPAGEFRAWCAAWVAAHPDPQRAQPLANAG